MATIKEKNMKSIKEKAEELSFALTEQEDDYYYSVGDAFLDGANYVLEEVERLLNSQRFVDNPSQELFELIKQLKK